MCICEIVNKRTLSSAIMEDSYSYSIPYVLFFCILFFLAYIDIRKTDEGKINWTVRHIAFVLLLIFFGIEGIYSDRLDFILYLI